MPSQHRTKLVGWHPGSADLADWIKAEADRRGVAAARILDEALEAYRRAVDKQAREGVPGNEE